MATLVTYHSDWGLDFNLKWDMGWMNDTTALLSGPISPYKPGNHRLLTFSACISSNTKAFVLPLYRATEVVHGKYDLPIQRMPGEIEWRQFAGMRALAFIR